MKRKIITEFSGEVFSMHLYVGGHEIPHVKCSSSKWSGKDEIDIVGNTVKIELKFIAPSFTDWELTIKFDGKEVLKDDGQSETSKFSYSKIIEVDSKPNKKIIIKRGRL